MKGDGTGGAGQDGKDRGGRMVEEVVLHSAGKNQEMVRWKGCLGEVDLHIHHAEWLGEAS